MNMDVENNLNGFDEFPSVEYLFRPTSSRIKRDVGNEMEIFTTRTRQVVQYMGDKGFNKMLVEEETNGLLCESITEIKTLPIGRDPLSDSIAFQTFYTTVDEFYNTAQEVNAKVTFDSYDKRTGHTAGNHVHISGNGIEDLMEVARIMQVYNPFIIVLANPDNQNNTRRALEFGYKNRIGIAYNPSGKLKNKKNDILIDMRNGLVEDRIIPMSKDLNTAYMIPQLLHRLISMAESDPEEMLKIEYLTNESPDGVSTYAEINRNRAIMDGLKAILYDVKFVMENGSLKAISYERHISEIIDEYLTKVGDYQQFVFD